MRQRCPERRLYSDGRRTGYAMERRVIVAATVLPEVSGRAVRRVSQREVLDTLG
ncbi:MAG TPA: hypothetical protein PLB88_03665 [Thermoanaerobaculaceae bacterium]|nr:hypothetical protein [Thermoanaerobaculaceae bacterium]HQU33389.1 hypothetical protein [Thermoanaerobaculaceae bacterium]